MLQIGMRVAVFTGCLKVSMVTNNVLAQHQDKN